MKLLKKDLTLIEAVTLLHNNVGELICRPGFTDVIKVNSMPGSLSLISMMSHDWEIYDKEYSWDVIKYLAQEWSATATYHKGEVVKYNDELYIALYTAKNTLQPGTGNYWIKLNFKEDD